MDWLFPEKDSPMARIKKPSFLKKLGFLILAIGESNSGYNQPIQFPPAPGSRHRFINFGDMAINNPNHIGMSEIAETL